MTKPVAVTHRVKAVLISAGAIGAILAPVASWAQSTPTIIQIPVTGAPPPPAGMNVACFLGPDTGEFSPTCPVIRYRGLNTWAFNFNDNRVSYGMVTYDGQANIINNTTLSGARYVYKMSVDPTSQTVSVWGQANAKVDLPWGALPTGTPVYAWVSAASPPPNVIKGPNMAEKPVCRGLGQYDRPWAGWWDGAACNGSYSGNRMLATKNVQFLTVVSGSISWVPGQSDRSNSVGPLPPNSVNAGKTYSGYDQVLCSYGGYIGWVYSNTCSQSGPPQRGIGPFVLTGTVN